MIYFTSDTHYGHGNVIRYSHRPYQNADEMDRDLIARHNAIVPKNGTLYHLGDFAFATKERQIEIMTQLNGNLHFLQGNHDKGAFFQAIAAANEIKRAKTGEFVRTVPQCSELKDNGVMIVMCHYGMRVWNKSHHGALHIYGHSHGSLPPFGKSVDVGVDAPFITGKPEYRPYKLDEVVSYLAKRKGETVDHHVAA